MLDNKPFAPFFSMFSVQTHLQRGCIMGSPMCPVGGMHACILRIVL